MAAGAVLSGYFKIEHVVSPEFANYSFMYKLVYCYGTLKQEMSTYLVGFCMMEAAPIMCGLAYSETEVDPHTKNQTHKHERVTSANIWKLETSYRVKDFLANWNMSN